MNFNSEIYFNDPLHKINNLLAQIRTFHEFVLVNVLIDIYIL